MMGKIEKRTVNFKKEIKSRFVVIDAFIFRSDFTRSIRIDLQMKSKCEQTAHFLLTQVIYITNEICPCVCRHGYLRNG